MAATPPPEPRFFATPAQWRRWLEKNHGKVALLWVGFHKVGSGRKSITWPESVDEALSFGWIDGIRKRLDDSSYMIRFTPRRAGSTWSAVNMRRVEALAAEGRMQPAGEKAFAARLGAKSAIYAYEQEPHALEGAYLAALKKDAKAWRFFSAQAPWYRHKASWWVTSAKREETRLKRLARLAALSAAGRLI